MVRFIVRRFRSLLFAISGVRYLLRTQRNAWLHLAATILVVSLGVALRVSAADWCWLVAAIAAVWVAEAINTALELLADATCPEHHPLIGRAKDVAAGAVLMASLGAAGVGGCVLGSRLGL